MKTIIRTKADIEESATNYNQTDMVSELKATALPLDAIANFCKIIESGDTPPKWMLRFLANRFADFLGNGGNKKMELCFNITPKQFSELKPDNTGEMMESYAMLMYLFGMTHDKTAEVIKLWYDYPNKATTLVYLFKHDYQSCFGTDWESRMEEMARIARATIFLEELKINQPAVFQKLKGCKTFFKHNSTHPIFV